MGYLTRYTLKSVEASPAYDAPSFLSCIKALVPYPLERPVSCTWYDHDSDIAAAMRDSGAGRVVLNLHGEDGDVVDKEYTLRPDGSIELRTYKHQLVRDTEPSVTVLKEH